LSDAAAPGYLSAAIENAMLKVFLALPLACPVLFACSDAAGPPFKPVASVKELMVSIVDPAADVVWDSVGTVISEEGVDEWYPKTEEEWAKVRNSAVVIMESGNLLMIGDRARDKLVWMELSQALVDAGAAAVKAADSRDPEAVFAVGETIYVACDRCHNLYWVGDEDRGRIRDTPKRPSK
jgi:hypothetical protein